METSYKMLIVDDDKFLLEMYRKKFEQNGALVEVASTPAEALDKLRDASKPQIIMLDVIMPGMDGLELLETIRKEKLAEGAIVIMLTNESESEKIEKAKSLGVAGYIVKATSIPSDVVDQTFKIAQSLK
jgi:CheY-like chemotaxis protein